MKQYQYATVSATSFIGCVAALRAGPNAYLSDNSNARNIRELLEDGYRFVTVEPQTGCALFEREISEDDVDRKHSQDMTELRTHLAARDSQVKYWESRAKELHGLLVRAVERLEASQPPEGYATDQVCKAAKSALNRKETRR